MHIKLVYHFRSARAWNCAVLLADVFMQHRENCVNTAMDEKMSLPPNTSGGQFPSPVLFLWLS